jgi:hypothetical protein
MTNAVISDSANSNSWGPMWPSSLSLRLSASSMLCWNNARWLTNLYLCVDYFFLPRILRLELAFKHVVLVGGFAASDWLFSKVQEKLLQHGMNITRPQNHVSVPPSFEINLVLTSHSGIRPFLMAPCHSISTALYALESRSVLMEISATRPSIPLIQITNKDSTMHILILTGPSVSRIPSLSFCQRFVYIPS